MTLLLEVWIDKKRSTVLLLSKAKKDNANVLLITHNSIYNSLIFLSQLMPVG
jgi:hypothetical protein